MKLTHCLGQNSCSSNKLRTKKNMKDLDLHPMSITPDLFYLCSPIEYVQWFLPSFYHQWFLPVYRQLMRQSIFFKWTIFLLGRSLTCIQHILPRYAYMYLDHVFSGKFCTFSPNSWVMDFKESILALTLFGVGLCDNNTAHAQLHGCIMLKLGLRWSNFQLFFSKSFWTQKMNIWFYRKMKIQEQRAF